MERRAHRVRDGGSTIVPPRPVAFAPSRLRGSSPVRGRLDHGFTLVEALIAVALGAIVVGTAFAGLRAAAACSATANRLSTENALMRVGYLMANDEVDLWTRYDDPDPTRPASARALRAAIGAKGCAFTPFSSLPSMASVAGDGDDARGWDPEGDWSPADPRTWYRGDLADRFNGALMHGRYAVVACAAREFDATMPSWFGASDGATTVTPLYGHVTVAHTWLDNQVLGLFSALGYYGMCEYMPPNGIFDAIEPYIEGSPDDPDATSPAGRPWWFANDYPTVDGAADSSPLAAGLRGTSPWFTNEDGAQRTPKGLYRLTLETAFALHDPSQFAAAADQLDWSRRRYHVGFSWATGQLKVDTMDVFDRRTGVIVAPLPVAPASWPSVRVSVHRFVRSRRFTAMSVIRWASAQTGEIGELPFSGFGTTLRGARRQRALAGGWARWDDAAGARPDADLDAPSAAYAPPAHPAVRAPVLDPR